MPVRALVQDKKAMAQMVLFSFLGLVLSQYAYLNAIKWTNSGTATVLQNLSIIFVAVFVCAAERTLPTKRTFFCICLAFFGVWLNSVFTPADLIGFVCILATVLIMK